MKLFQGRTKFILCFALPVLVMVIGYYVFRIYLAPSKPLSSHAMNEMLYPVKIPYNWDSPPLPSGTKVDFKLEKGTVQKGDRRVQYMCSSSQTQEEVSKYYDDELTKAGWKKLTASPEDMKKMEAKIKDFEGIQGGLYRMGNLSLAIHIFKKDSSCMFRLSVIMMPEI